MDPRGGAHAKFYYVDLPLIEDLHQGVYFIELGEQLGGPPANYTVAFGWYKSEILQQVGI